MMNFFQIASLLITLSALFSYLNFQYVRMPTKIGVMGIALALSIALLTGGLLGVPGARHAILVPSKTRVPEEVGA